jgi:hypothetical protein
MIRSAAGLAGFLILIQLLTRPLRYGRSRRLDSVPSRIVFARCSDTPVLTPLLGKTDDIRDALKPRKARS